MKFATLDVLDKNLSRDYQNNINAIPQHRFAFYKEELMLDPNYWNSYYEQLNKYNFNWTEFKYQDVVLGKININNIINQDHTGVYLFIVKGDELIYDLPKFVLYVGIAGENDSARPLRERLSDYFHIEQIKKRGKVHSLLKKYYNNVYIAFSYVQKPSEELKNIEKYLHGFFYPIYCDRDFPVELKQLRKAFP